MGGTLHPQVTACHLPCLGHPPLGHQGPHRGHEVRPAPNAHTKRVPSDGPRWT